MFYIAQYYFLCISKLDFSGFSWNLRDLAVHVRGSLQNTKINSEISRISFGKNTKVTLTKLNLISRYCKHMFLDGIGTRLDVGIKVLHRAVIFLSYISKLDFSEFLGISNDSVVSHWEEDPFINTLANLLTCSFGKFEITLNKLYSHNQILYTRFLVVLVHV